MNLAQLAEDRVKERGESPSLIFEDRVITNGEMIRASRRLAQALKDLGIGKGDRVILQMPNCPEVLQGFQAVWRIGAVIVPINYLIGEEETAYIYRDSGAKALIGAPSFWSKIQAARDHAPALESVVLTGRDEFPGTFSYERLTAKTSEDSELAQCGDDDLAALIYTAGTTGKPKGVMHSHGGLYSNARMQHESISLPDDLSAALVLPLCHSYGIATVNHGLFRRGGASVLLPTFDVRALLSAMEKYRLHLMAGVPTMYVFLLLHPDARKFDVSSMKYWLSGGAPLPLEVWKKFREVYGCEIIEGWGLTEAGANNAVNPFDGPKKVGSVGRPMKGTELKVVDWEGRELPPLQEGEIFLRGPMVMKGYWNKPEETAKVLQGGWLHTGDIGYKDEDGFIWITDRKKDLIIKAGENISPRAIEEVLFQHPKVSEAAVVGAPDEIYGEEIRAFIVLKTGEAATSGEILDFARARLTRFLVPKEIIFRKSLPKNLLGKVLKRELRKTD